MMQIAKKFKMAAVKSDVLDIALEADTEYMEKVEDPRKWLPYSRKR